MADFTPIPPHDAVSNIVTCVEGWEVGKRAQDMGRVVAFDQEPTYLIERADGTRFSWRASWCRASTTDELMNFALKLMQQPVYPKGERRQPERKEAPPTSPG